MFSNQGEGFAYQKKCIVNILLFNPMRCFKRLPYGICNYSTSKKNPTFETFHRSEEKLPENSDVPLDFPTIFHTTDCFKNTRAKKRAYFPTARKNVTIFETRDGFTSSVRERPLYVKNIVYYYYKFSFIMLLMHHACLKV